MSSLADLTTLRVGGPARRLVTVSDEAELIAAVHSADAEGSPLLLVGGGSNLVVSDAGFDGTVVHIASRGIHVHAIDAEPDGCIFLGVAHILQLCAKLQIVLAVIRNSELSA